MVKCSECGNKLTPITTVITEMKKMQNDRKVRRGMSNYRACYGCDLILKIGVLKS